jgi:hypothetical protein
MGGNGDNPGRHDHREVCRMQISDSCRNRGEKSHELCLIIARRPVKTGVTANAKS